jgi:hypothetical protein
MTITMTISDPEWTIAENAKAWEDEETPEVAAMAADTVEAWLINNTSTRKPGWDYRNGTFTISGEAANWSNLVDAAHNLIIEANDYAIENIEEIREMAAENASA